MLTQIPTDTLVLNTAIEHFCHTKDVFKAWNAATEVSNKNGFTLPFWLVFFGCDVLKLIH